MCHTETGQQVRAGIFSDDFLTNLLATLAPFLVLAVIVVSLYFCFPKSTQKEMKF
jgi:hypothetical protein